MGLEYFYSTFAAEVAAVVDVVTSPEEEVRRLNAQVRVKFYYDDYKDLLNRLISEVFRETEVVNRLRPFVQLVGGTSFLKRISDELARPLYARAPMRRVFMPGELEAAANLEDYDDPQDAPLPEITNEQDAWNHLVEEMRLNEKAGAHGVGRVDMVEDRLVGIKSREIYEAPAAVTLLAAHEALEALTLSKDQQRLKARIAQEYAELIYNGLWFTAHHQDLAAYVQSTQRHVTGTVRVKLHKGLATVVGRKSPKSLYDFSLATYDKADQFDRTAAPGFIHIWGLPVRVQAEAQKGEEGP